MPTIRVNGDDWDYNGDAISYTDVVMKVCPRFEPPLHAVTYHWRGDGDIHRQGIMSPTSKPIRPEDGMIFEAVYIP